MLIQFLLNAVISAAGYLMVAIGFGLIYSTAKFFHLAYGAFIPLGAYLFLCFLKTGLSGIISCVLSTILCGLIAIVMNSLIYNKLKRRGAGALVLMLASFGIYLVMENMMALIWGTATQGFNNKLAGSIFIFGGYITVIQLITFFLAFVVWILVFWIYQRSKLGWCLKAIAQSTLLSRAIGIQVFKVENCAFFLGSIIASLVGILFALDIGVTPTMGLQVLIMGMVIVIVGGAENLIGMLFTSLSVGLIRHFSIVFVNSQWQDTTVFILLLFFLLIFPHRFYIN